MREDADWRETISAHPVVATHPETGRKLLYVNRSYTFGLEGMTEEESAPLLHFLLEHRNRPEFTCRFRWKKGSFWDNRSCKHRAVRDAGEFRRVMRRTQIKGPSPKLRPGGAALSSTAAASHSGEAPARQVARG